MRRILLSLPFLLLLLAPAAEAQTVSVPNTLTNGSVAEADAMNANFTELEVGINAALTTGSVSVPNTFTNGTTADARRAAIKTATGQIAQTDHSA